MRNLLARLFSFFKKQQDISIGVYGPPNVGKTTLANRISSDLTGEELGSVSEIPHETREIQKKERMELQANANTLSFNLLDMPGISTKVDYRDFTEHGMEADAAKGRAKEATKGIVEAIKFLEEVDACLVVFDATEDPYTQVNITVLGNLEAKQIPIVIVANKIDGDNADPATIEEAFPQHPMVEISAKEGTNMEQLYDTVVHKLAH